MKIKLAILESDQSYLNRIVTAFSTKYSDKFQIYSFTNPDMAFNVLESEKIDVLIANDSFDIDVSALPQRCTFAYFVDSKDVDTHNEQVAISKFQKAEMIYKQILSLYSENAGKLTGLKLNDDASKLFVFATPSGGAGSSAMAAACAKHFASKGKKTLYLNLEDFGSSDVFFSGEGQFNMSDIIFALKSKKANLSMKLESCVKQDESGVYFFSQSNVALDMLELTNEEKLRLISELKLTGSYDYIILDMDFGLSKDFMNIYKQANSIVAVGDGSDSSNSKIHRAYVALSTMEQGSDVTIANRLLLLYNKFSNKTGKALADTDIKNIGGAPRYEHATVSQVVDQLSKLSDLDKIDF